MSFLSIILGRRLASDEQKGQRIGVFYGLPALGLDGLSSSAYGPEAALTILLPLGAMGLHYIGPITVVILALLAMLYFSYRQTIAAYPRNGGSYTVAKENLGSWASLLAASALMLDYVLTVAVGISAGIAALVSAAPRLHAYTLPLCLIVLAIITVANLRGTGEAGAAFALPTYIFIACMAAVLGIGLYKSFTTGGHPSPLVSPPPLPPPIGQAGTWILLRAFASGCAAMTGVEAVSNGVGAFEEPAVKKAHQTLTLIVVILAALLGGIAYLTYHYHVGAMNQEHAGYQSVLSQLTEAVIGRGWVYKLTITSILAVLCLSANTSFVGFPRLCQLIAKDDFLPRGFAAIGRRLVYSVGVLFLAGSAALLLAAFGGITDKLIPLYAVGAFLAFTLSQSGMVVHWLKQMRGKSPPADGPRPGRSTFIFKIFVNGIGAVATAVALSIILVAKFTAGAWITVIVIPILLGLFKWVHNHYAKVERQVDCPEALQIVDQDRPVVLLPLHRWSKPIYKSLQFAMQLSGDVVAVHLGNLEGDETDDAQSRIRQEWAEKVENPTRAAGLTPPRLEFVKTPYREFTKPLLVQIDAIKQRWPRRPVAVIIPEVVERHWWQTLLHSRRASRLRSALRSREDFRVVVIDLPWFIQDSPPAKSTKAE